MTDNQVPQSPSRFFKKIECPFDLDQVFSM